jgi:hypothetical protein
MPFAIAMSLVLLISTSVLLYQFWTRSLMAEEPPAPPHEQSAEAPSAPYIEQAA